MKIIRSTESVCLKNSIITLGKFDGFHIGHRLLIDRAMQLKNPDHPTVIFTFDMHPVMLTKEQTHPTHTILSRKERSLIGYPKNVDYVVEFPFTKETMEMEPETFVKQILVDRLGVRRIICGYDFRFGKGRAGDAALLRKLGGVWGFSVEVLDKITICLPGRDHPEEISSTLIKQEIENGRLENAEKMLGYPFCLAGVVQHGKHLGTSLGFPTINLSIPEDKIVPPYGVYATRTLILDSKGQILPDPLDKDALPGITNVGVRPTFADGKQITAETHLFDVDMDLYGKQVIVFFYHFVRPERQFADVRELVAEIDQNRREVRTFFHLSEAQ